MELSDMLVFAAIGVVVIFMIGKSNVITPVSSNISQIPQTQTAYGNETIDELKARVCDKPLVERIDTYFCPEDACASHIIPIIEGTQNTLYIAMYSFTHKDLYDAVIRAKQRGVDVRVLFDLEQSAGKSSVDEDLRTNMVQVRYDTNQGVMENRYLISDGRISILGSMSYSDESNINNNNLIVIVSNYISNSYKENFFKLWETGAIKAPG